MEPMKSPGSTQRPQKKRVSKNFRGFQEPFKGVPSGLLGVLKGPVIAVFQ